MRLHRFFVSADLSRPVVSVTDAELCHQLGKVLRLEPADHLILVDGNGNETEAVISRLDAKALEVQTLGMRTVAAEPVHHVTLCCAILKRENFELVVQKATECGVSEIIPLMTERTVKTGIKMERLRAIAKEAAEQSGRGEIPVIHEPTELKKALEISGNKFFFHVGTSVHPPQFSENPAILFIGPEGGWTEDEANQARENGCTVSGLGKLTLRGETAAIVASFIYCNKMI